MDDPKTPHPGSGPHGGRAVHPAAASLHAMALRAFDLSERTARAGMTSQRRRVDRWRSRLWMICQIAVAAGSAWFLCQRLLHHPMPFFGSVAAMVSLGFSFGERLSRVVELAVGVSAGVLIGDVFVHFFGTGVWQIIVVCFIAMSFATWLGAGKLMVTQAGVQAVLVVTLLPAPNQGMSRWLDALVGCALALIITTIAPSGPVQRPRQLAADVLDEVAATLRVAAQAKRSGDDVAAQQVLDRARATQATIESLDAAAAEGLAVVRTSPFLRRHEPSVQQLADLRGPLDRIVRNLRVLARRTAVATWRGEAVPQEYLGLIEELASLVDSCARDLDEHRLPESSVPALIELAGRTSTTSLQAGLSAIVMLAQVRSMIVDLLELSGMVYEDARDVVPEMADDPR